MKKLQGKDFRIEVDDNRAIHVLEKRHDLFEAIEIYKNTTVGVGETKLLTVKVPYINKYISITKEKNKLKKKSTQSRPPKKDGYTAIEIADFVVKYCGRDANYMLSPSKLSYILYFIQGNFYRTYDTHCFFEDFEAWRYGAVIPSVYKKYRHYASNYITRVESNIEKNENNEWVVVDYKKPNFKIGHEELIIKVIELCKHDNHLCLGSIIKNQKPWLSTDESKKIDKEVIRTFFREVGR